MAKKLNCKRLKKVTFFYPGVEMVWLLPLSALSMSALPSMGPSRLSDRCMRNRLKSKRNLGSILPLYPNGMQNDNWQENQVVSRPTEGLVNYASREPVVTLAVDRPES